MVNHTMRRTVAPGWLGGALRPGFCADTQREFPASIFASCCSEGARQMWALPSALMATSRLPSGENLTRLKMEPSPASVATSCRVATSHSLTASLPTLPEASRWPCKCQSLLLTQGQFGILVSCVQQVGHIGPTAHL